ncbi:MAG: tetratricopeptide repeat protein [Bryobacteraceae bacterium]
MFSSALVIVAAFLAAGQILVAGTAEAKALLDAGKYAEAGAAYREALKRSPNDPLALAGLGMALNGTGLYLEAITPLTKAVEADPRNAAVLRELIRAFVGSNSFGEAERFLGVLLKANQQDREGWYLFGVLLLQNGYYATAERAFARAVEPGAAPGKASVYRAVCQLQLNRQAEAEEAFRSLSGQPHLAGDLDLLIGFAQLSYEMGDFERGAALSKKAATLAPDNAEAGLWHTRCLTKLGQWRPALAEAERVAAVAPDRPQIHHLLLRIYRQVGDNRLAERETAWLRAHGERRAAGAKP